MMLNLDQTIVYRIPRFPFDKKLEECWEELKAAIAASSKDFYQQIEQVSAEDLDHLPERTKLTIWKYFNRARYRCVPYGSFGSVGSFNLYNSKETPLVISSQIQTYEFTDWSAIDQYQPEIILNDEMLLFSNGSWYLTTNGMRYIAKDKEGYELLDNVQDATVLEILKHCERPISIANLNNLLSEPVSLDELKELLYEMIGLQMLFTSAHSNIIGPDYWSKTPYQAERSQQKYEISTKDYVGGTLPARLFRHVPELAERLARMVAENKSTALNNFIEGFLRKFEGKEIPLMVALDPEMGLGYADLENGSAEDELVAGLAARRIQREKKDSPIEEFFRRQLGVDQVKVIELEELEPGATKDDEPLPIANTTSLLCSVADELLVIDLFGGATGNALHGRFSLASEDIRKHCKALCRIESEANPDVLFFDIAYQVGNRIDNVNRREQLYDYVLSILNFDTSAEPLSLADMLVSISGGKVLLRSKKHNKRVIPRLASAYNYTKSDLPVFRFLCEVQHQGIQSYLQLDLSVIFKGLNYYPRVQYKNIVVCPAKWLLKKESLFNKKQKDVAHCRQQLTAAGVGRYFKCGFSDQTLTYNTESDEDMEAFLSNIEKQNAIQVEEAIIGSRADVIDENGKVYASQFVLNYTHDEQIYNGFANPAQVQKSSLKLPGSEWLYFEVFCHPQRADVILQEYVRPFVSKQVHQISQWFFIRYTENGPHLRLRFKLNHTGNLQTLLQSFTELLRPELESGIVSDLAVKTYKREVQRYSEILMDAVEEHFCVDSACVLTLLESQPKPEWLYQHCIELIRKVAESNAFEYETFENLLQRISASFNREHQLKAPEFRKLNEAYKRFSQHSPALWNQLQQHHAQQIAASLTSILRQCEQERREALFADLIHMHVNRLFGTNQRSHEMVMYYYCHKQFISRKWNRVAASAPIP